METWDNIETIGFLAVDHENKLLSEDQPDSVHTSRNYINIKAHTAVSVCFRLLTLEVQLTPQKIECTKKKKEEKKE